MKLTLKSVIIALLVLLSGLSANANVAEVRLLTASTAATQTSSTVKTLAITPANTSTAGDDLVVAIARKTATATVVSVVSSVASAVFLPYTGELPNGSSNNGNIWVCHKCASITTGGTITVNTSANGVFAVAIVEYSGVASYGQAAAKIATSTGPNESITTQDANNMIVFVSSSLGSGGIPSAGTGCGTTSGNLRVAGRTGTTSSHVAIGFCDQAAASAGTAVSLTDTITSVAWTGTALELRSATAPMTDHVGSYGAHNFNSQDATTGQDFLVPMMGDKALTGNTALCVGFWPAGIAAPTVSDDNTDTVTKDNEIDGANVRTAIWRVATTAGARLAKFHFTSALSAGTTFSASCSNFSKALTVDSGATPTCGSASVSTGPNLSCGALNLSAADIIFVVASADNAFGYVPGGTTPGGFMGPCREGNGYTLLIPAIMTGYCSEYTVTAGSGTPNPPIYFGEWASGTNSANTTNSYNIIGVAYAIGAAGTAPSGMYVSREWLFGEGATTGYVNCPSSGNFMSSAHTAGAVFTVKDSNQVAWTKNQPITNTAANFNTSSNSSLDSSSMCSFANTDANNDEAFIRDIAGAATSSVIVVPTACTLPSTLVNTGNNIGCYNTSLTGTTPTQTDGPDLTPANSGDGILAGVGFGTGPSISCSAPSGCFYDCPTYTGIGDGNGFCFGEGHMHYFATSTSALNFGWNMGSGSGTPTNGSAAAIEVKKAPSVSTGRLRGFVIQQ